MKDKEFIKLRDKIFEEIEPKAIKSQIDSWNFYTNSTDENMKEFEKSMEEISKSFRNEEIYNKLKEIEKSGLEDKHLAKQLMKLINNFEGALNEGEQEKLLFLKESEIMNKYNKFVPMLDGKEKNDTEIDKIIQKEKNIDLRKKAYRSIVKRGDLIAEDLVNLVKMRNEFAKTKGYKSFFEFMLEKAYKVDSNNLQNLIDELYDNIKEINEKLQSKQQKELADEYGIGVDDLREYHSGLLLDNSPAKEINKYLKTKEQVVDICKKAYLGMGYDIDNLPITLDLFPRKNKNNYGFCFTIEAGKDARILANLTNTTGSIDTLCHELGHSVYHLGINRELAYIDQTAYPAITEAVAIMMGDLKQSEDILKGIVADEILEKYKKDLKKSEAISINNYIFYIAFEKAMYENPDQNLQLLWHNLKVKYTGSNDKNELNNNWATILHFISHPCYIQNYFRAKLIKAQMYKHLHKELGNLTENKNTAAYLNNNLFKYGTSMEENELIEKFTGESLSSKAFCESLA